MEMNQTDTPDEKKQEGLDLSSLLNVDFVSKGWEENKNRQAQQTRESRTGRGPASRQDRRDRRNTHAGSDGAPGHEHRPRRGRRDSWNESAEREPRRGPQGRHEPDFQKPVEIQFFPEEHAFNALVKALRQSGQTHELFALARLFLEKPERLMIAINPLPEAGEDARMFVCKIDGTPFLSEDEVYQHVFEHHLEQFVRVEEVEIEAPKGSFQAVARCPVTQVLICPPNYHRYPQAVLEHKERYFPEQSVDWVRNRLELVREEEVIQQWLDSMRKKILYRMLPKKSEGGRAQPVQEEESQTDTSPNPVTEPATEASATSTEPVEAVVADQVPEPAESAPATSEAAVDSTVAAVVPDLVFDNLEELKAHFREHLRHRVLKSMRQYRIEGKQLAALPDSLIRKSIELDLEEQRRFPLETANHLRGRFRRLKFDLFKHGDRGINYVSPVKRKVKESQVPWSDSVEVLYGRIAQLPVATIQSLTEAVLGNPLEYYQGAMAEKLREDEKRSYATLIADLHWLVMEGYVTRFDDGHLEILKTAPAVKSAREESSDTDS